MRRTASVGLMVHRTPFLQALKRSFADALHDTCVLAKGVQRLGHAD